MRQRFILFTIILLQAHWLNAQSTQTLDEFTNNSNYFSAFNNGSGSVSTSISSAEFISGNSSLAVNYSFNSGTGFFFSSFRGYGTATQDYSFMTNAFSISHKGGNATSTISIRLWEDSDNNGLFDGTDEVYTSNAVLLGSVGWATTDFLITNFTLVTGIGNGLLDLNRIRAWDIKIQNTLSTSNSGLVYLDRFQLKSSYTPPTSGTAKLNGSFTQLWNSAGCSCGQWTQGQWENEFQKMKDLCMDKFIVQYSVYNDLSWYNNSSLSFVVFKETALDKIILAAETKGMKIYFGLYFDETWNSSNKSLSATYSSLLTKHQGVIDEIWNEFGSSSAFGGWYIPQELNDLEWQQNPQKTLLFNWLNNVSSYAHSKSSAPVIIAPFFNLWQPADQVATWYTELFTAAPNIDAVYPQDGVGITLKSATYHIPLYFEAIEAVCNSNGVLFGATIESFAQQTGWPIDGGSFSATSADINRLKSQLWNSAAAGAVELIQFEWSYMQNGLTASSTTLYNDYNAYATSLCAPLSLDFPKSGYGDSKNNQVFCYPNPTKELITVQGLSIPKDFNFLNVMGESCKEKISIEQISEHSFLLKVADLTPGIYFFLSPELSQIIVKE